MDRTRWEGEPSTDVFLWLVGNRERGTPRIGRRPAAVSKVARAKAVEAARRIMAMNYFVVLRKAPETPPMEPFLIVR
jgi:hypothetical protein